MTVDLDAVLGAVGDARVVALGEAAHNLVECHQIRMRLFSELVDRGFTALVLESGFAEGLALDDWVQGGSGSVEQIATTAINYGFGLDSTVHRQLTWMREHGGLRVYGMDLSGDATSPGPAVRALVARLPAADGDEDLVRHADLGRGAEAALRWAALDPAEQDRLLADLEGLVSRGRASGDPIAERLAASLRGSMDELRYDGVGPYPREVFMADTIRWILQREARILVSAHNGHVQRGLLEGKPMLGGLLADLGEGLVTIATRFERGPLVRITERSARPYDWDVDLEEAGASEPLEDDLFDHVLNLGEVHRVPGAFERLCREVAPYPPTRRVDITDHPAGIPVPDPYRWLEAEDAEVHAWQRRQADLATATIFSGQDRRELRRLIERYDVGARPTLPRYAAGAWFREADGAIVRASEPFGEGVLLLRLADLVAPEQVAVLSWLAPSPDGRHLALGICTDGSEHNTIRLMDLATGALLPAPVQVLHSAWAGGVTWQADGEGFWFLALTGPPQDFTQAVFHHRLEDALTQIEPVPVPAETREYTLIQASSDGRWLVASHRVGNPVPYAVRDLQNDQGWRLFVTAHDGTVAGHIVGDRYIAVTDVGAARGRVVAIPLDAKAPNDPGSWEELVPEGQTVLRSVMPIGDCLCLSEFDHTFARVRTFDVAGTPMGEIPMPGRGALAAPFFALTDLAARTYAPEFVFAFSTLISSWGVYRHRPGTSEVDALREPEIVLDAVVEVGSATREGVEIPFHRVRLAGGASGPTPTLISAYGAANVPTLPQYQPDLAAFIAAGGTLVQAYLRGGGEFGRDWYLAGHRENKSVRDHDLVAVATHLIDAGLTTPEQLALTGGSDGGLMCGVAVTIRPDLWRAVLARAPLLDLVAGMRDPYLEFVIRKAWGDPDDPVDVQRMLSLSPYELVRAQAFPAVYLQAGANDPRCRPWHARKFGARLQAAQRGDAPILIHVFDNAGHGAGTDPTVLIAQDTEWLGFLVKELNLLPVN